jgi:hypothetical protein
MRRRAAVQALAVTAALTAATLLAACGTVPQSGGSLVGTQTRSQTGSFTRQAKQVIALWDRSRPARVWHTGLVLTGARCRVGTAACARHRTLIAGQGVGMRPCSGKTAFLVARIARSTGSAGS